MVDVGSVGMEIATAIRVFRQTDRQTDDGQNVVRKVHANIETGPLPSKIVSVVRQTLVLGTEKSDLCTCIYIYGEYLCKLSIIMFQVSFHQRTVQHWESVRLDISFAPLKVTCKIVYSLSVCLD